MTARSKALIWASIIIAAALLASGIGMSDAASFGLIAGLTGAAWGSIHGESGCGQNCPL